MTPELWDRLKPLFYAAADRPPGERDVFIAEACGGDGELRQHLVDLLEAHDQPTLAQNGPGLNLKNLLSTATRAFSDGEVVLGRFKIVGHIDGGGMGEVYEAIDTQLGQTIALKTIRPVISGNAAVLELFKKEVLHAQHVSGRNVCRIHDLFLVPGKEGAPDCAFLTMEFLRGVTLARKLHKDGPLPWKKALPIALDICEGLRLIHEQGIIHRDLKSGNIMWCEQAGAVRVVVMDFGLAHDFRLDEAATDSSTNGDSLGKAPARALVGTPEYMAPEQFEGKPVSPATDIYALGIVLYELITGVHPYAAPTPVAAAIRRAKPLRPPSSIERRIPRQWDRIIARCMQYEPEHRYQSAPEVAKALSADPVSFESLRQDRPWIFYIAYVIALVAIAWGAVHWWNKSRIYRPSAEVLHWYNPGLAALREGTYVKATLSLEQAVKQDDEFAMGHARLAEAWEDLDFEGDAQRELLLAMPDEKRLEPLDRMYLNAIRATISRDYKRAITDYQQILHHLPPNEQSSGYVDLGMVYERAQDPAHALENYARAAQVDRNSPAPYVHTAILQSRQHHVPEAEQAFQRAQTLFTAEMNQEGLAELDYERGFASNDRGDPIHAEPYLKKSLEEAVAIGSVQLQIRVLTQLSSAAYATDHDGQAVQYAEQAITLARDNRLDSWAANGIVRLANAQLHQGKLKEAEETINEALQLARQSNQPHVEAMANLTLASIKNQMHLPDQVIGPAQAALDYYKKNGYFTAATSASFLLIRTHRDKGEYAQALQSGNESLALATTSGIRSMRMSAEEVVGTVYLEMERYPDALLHFQNALSFADAASSRSYQEVHIAKTLWKLGRFHESELALQSVPQTDTFKPHVDPIRVSSLLSEQRYKAADALASEILAANPDMDERDKEEFQLDKVVAESHLGMKEKARDELQDLSTRRKNQDPVEAWHTDLVVAEANLYTEEAQEAHKLLVSAANHFEATGQLDSELRSVCLAAAASKQLKDKADLEVQRKKAVDILGRFQQTWDPQALHTYLSIPDLRALMSGINLAGPSDRK